MVPKDGNEIIADLTHENLLTHRKTEGLNRYHLPSDAGVEGQVFRTGRSEKISDVEK